MDAPTTLHLLVNGGFAVGIDGENLTVRPVSRLTDKLRQAIRANKPELLALLRKAKPHAPPPLSAADREAIREAIAERAAIREFDGGESRQVAEREARSAMRVYRYRLADRPDAWLTMIAPGCDPDEARRSLELRFGAERLTEVREHRTAPNR